MVFLIVYFSIADDTKEYKELINKNNPSDALPAEIHTRLYWRIALHICLILFSCFIAVHKFDTAFEMVTIYLQWILLFMIPICIEYLLCTTSLPPGEKERKQIEKEMSSLVPIKIRN